MEKSRIRSKKGSHGSWQEAAAQRLKGETTSLTKQSQKIKNNEESELLTKKFDDGPTITDLEAELDNLMKKLETENASILEVKAVNSKSRDYRNVIKQAKNGTNNQTKESDPSFFITSVTGEKDGTNEDSPSKACNISKYPNFEKEVKLAKELKMDKMDKKMAKLQAKAHELHSETSSVLNKAKTIKTKKVGDASVEKKLIRRRSKAKVALPSLVKKR